MRGAIEGGRRCDRVCGDADRDASRTPAGFADEIDRAGVIQAQAAPVSCENHGAAVSEVGVTSDWHISKEKDCDRIWIDRIILLTFHII